MSFDPRLPDDRVNVSGTHPIREAALLVGGLVAIMVALAVGSALAVDWVVPRLPTSLEVKLFGGGWLPGSGAAAGEPGEEEMEPDPATAELQALVDRLAGHWRANPYELHVMVWDSEVPNAFALPGGWIGVTTGLLVLVESENELAFVLGHEIGHFRNRDHLRGLGRGVATGIVLAAAGMSGAGVAGDLAGLAAALAQRSFDREQESDADRFGLDLVAAEYGHVAGSGEFFRHMPEAGGLLDEELEAYLSTHPLSEARIQEMAAHASAQGLASDGELLALSEGLAAAADPDPAPAEDDPDAG